MAALSVHACWTCDFRWNPGKYKGIASGCFGKHLRLETNLNNQARR